MILSLIAVGLQSTWYVDASATAPGNGTQNAPYTSVEFALAQGATQSGDTVLVAPGHYTSERIDFLGKAVTVRSTDGAATTILQAPPLGFPPGSVVTFKLGEGPGAVLEGFTLVGTQGQPTALVGPGLPFAGGGIFCAGGSSPTLRDLVITGGGSVEFGAGLFLDGGAPTLERLRFEDCGATPSTAMGGGLWARNATVLLEDCSFEGCTSLDRGAGLWASGCNVQGRGTSFANGTAALGSGGGACLLGGSHLFDDCSFSGNDSGDPGGGLYAADCLLALRDSLFATNTTGVDLHPGGGLAYENPGGAPGNTLSIQRCRFEGNVGNFGGGASVDGTATVRDSVFDFNVTVGGQVSSGGGGLRALGNVSVTGCVFTRNVSSDAFSLGGGGVLGDALVDRCTFVNNSATGGASALEGAGAFQNSIVRGGSLPRIAAALAPTYCNIQGGAAGTGNIDEPALFHFGALDVHLLPGSPCIDVASPSAGNDPDGSRADMGAFPFDPYHCGPACEGFVGVTTCASLPNSTGVGAFLEGVGSTTVSDQFLVLNVTNIPRNQFGLFVISSSAGSQMLGGGSQGLLCVGFPLVRFNAVVSDRGTGVASFAPDLDSINGIGAIQPGESWYFQYWFRDQNPFLTSNTSTALRVDFR